MTLPADSLYGLDNLPYGVFSRGEEPRRVGVRIGERVLDLALAARDGLFDELPSATSSAFASGSLNAFMARGPRNWTAARRRIRELLADERLSEAALPPLDEVRLHLPFEVADYVDFYSSLEHATNLGRLFRPDGDPLLPNWRHLPVGYHGRAGTVVVSGTPIARPHGQSVRPGSTAPVFGPSRRLDFELEVGFVAGSPSHLGVPVPVSAVRRHIFGLVLVNDWSARDIQAWEYQPLGPFLGKSFATSVSPWVVPLEALEPYRVPGPAQDPPVLPYLFAEEPRNFALDLEIGLRSPAMACTETIAATSFRHMYWSIGQQLAHATANGASVRTGDLYASGTVSGPEPRSRGSLIELTWNGAEPLTLADGTQRTFLEDGDEVVLSGTAGGGALPRIGLGEVRGTIVPALGTA